MRVLVVEDDPDLAGLLREGLVEEGYAVDLEGTRVDGLWRATTVDYDVIVLDVMLPDGTGIELLRALRRQSRTAPVILLTARDTTEDRVIGLDAGADDYLVKPFTWDELLARIRALLRRGAQGAPGALTFGALELDPAQRELRAAGKPVPLTAKEFAIIWVLMRQPGRVLTRTQIVERVYDDESGGGSNVIDVLLGRIRKKLAAAGVEEHIRTVRGAGYALAASGE